MQGLLLRGALGMAASPLLRGGSNPRSWLHPHPSAGAGRWCKLDPPPHASPLLSTDENAEKGNLKQTEPNTPSRERGSRAPLAWDAEARCQPQSTDAQLDVSPIDLRGLWDKAVPCCTPRLATHRLCHRWSLPQPFHPSNGTNNKLNHAENTSAVQEALERAASVPPAF